jgi:predicted Na+-dependent transporter
VRRYWFLCGLLGVATAAIAFPEGGNALRSARPILPALTATNLFLSGLALETAHLRPSVANVRGIALCLGTTYGVAPALALVLAVLFAPATEPDRGFFREAVAIAAAQAGTIASAPALVLVAGGNHGLALLATLASNGLTAVATPLVLFVLLGARVTFPLGEMIEKLLRLVLAPVAAGQIARRILRDGVQRTLPAVRILSQAIILVFVYAGISAAAGGGRAPAGLVLRFFGLAGALHGGLLACGWAMASASGLSPRDRTAVVLCGAQKTLPNGIYVWDRFFPANPHGALAIVAYHVLQLVADTLLLPWLSPPPADTRGGVEPPGRRPRPGDAFRSGVFRASRPAR